MANLSKCSVTGCENPVSKTGYTLCYKHWLVESKSRSTKNPESIESEKVNQANLLTSTTLGEKLGVDSKKVNQVLSELGWVERSKKGWVPTTQGKKLHAESREHHLSGVPFVLWPEAIVTSKILKNTVQEFLGNKNIDSKVKHEVASAEVKQDKQVGFRDKFKPTHRAMDGHWVRSKAEGLVDNWLYMSGIVHAYERLLPVEEELYCDFYVPAGKVYIEYWGLENDPKYRERKEQKKEIYKKIWI